MVNGDNQVVDGVVEFDSEDVIVRDAAAPASAAASSKPPQPAAPIALRKSTRMVTAGENIATYLERHLN